jgi:cytochrome c553
MKVACLLVISVLCGPLAAEEAKPDAVRGAALFADTGRLTGRPVASCRSCHANAATLREMIANRGAKTRDPKALAAWLIKVFDGAQPGAANAKAQYRGVLSHDDLRDIAAYLAGSSRG